MTIGFILFNAYLMFRKICFTMFILFSSLAISAEKTKDFLDVSISVFDMNLPGEQVMQELNIYAEVRSAESRYMPALLQATMLESDRWGAIRILPSKDESAELMIEGEIIHSDGLRLELKIFVQDSSGYVWINKNYVADVKEGVSLMEVGLNIDPFQHLYEGILNDLTFFYEQLSSEEVLRLKSLSQLRYAIGVSPVAFSEYLIKTPDDLYTFERLPAQSDPLLLRVQEIRQHEYLFIDVVDSQYQDYLLSIKPVYDKWRDYQQEMSNSSVDFLDRLDSDRQFSRGSYRALSSSYNNYRWQKMQSQYLDQLSEGFKNEVQETELNLEDSIYRLSGTMSEQYLQWKEILQSMYELDNNE